MMFGLLVASIILAIMGDYGIALALLGGGVVAQSFWNGMVLAGEARKVAAMIEALGDAGPGMRRDE